MRRFICPHCHVKLLVGLKGIAICENCKAFYDVGHRRRHSIAPLSGHPLMWVFVLTAFAAIISFVFVF